MEIIASRQNPKIKYAIGLRDRAFRDAEGAFWAEGENWLKDLDDPACVRALYVAKSKRESFAYLIERYADRTVIAEDKVFAAAAGTATPCGVAAILEKPRPRAEGGALCAVLDGISDPGNLGTIIRTCAACGVRDVWLLDCADPYNGKAARASMGGVLRVNLLETDAAGLSEALADYDLYGLDMAGENLFEERLGAQRIALAVGSEARGLSPAVRERCKGLLALPMTGKMESLNAAIGFSVALYVFRYGKNGGGA